MDREENLLIAKNLLRVIEKLQRAGRRGDIVGVIANELDVKDRKAAQQSVHPTGNTRPVCGRPTTEAKPVHIMCDPASG